MRSLLTFLVEDLKIIMFINVLCRGIPSCNRKLQHDMFALKLNLAARLFDGEFHNQCQMQLKQL